MWQDVLSRYPSSGQNIISEILTNRQSENFVDWNECIDSTLPFFLLTAHAISCLHIDFHGLITGLDIQKISA